MLLSVLRFHLSGGVTLALEWTRMDWNGMNDANHYRGPPRTNRQRERQTKIYSYMCSLSFFSFAHFLYCRPLTLLQYKATIPDWWRHWIEKKNEEREKEDEAPESVMTKSPRMAQAADSSRPLTVGGGGGRCRHFKHLCCWQSGSAAIW